MGVGGGGPSLPGGLEMRGTKWNVLGDSQCQPVVRLGVEGLVKLTELLRVIQVVNEGTGVEIQEI